MQKRKECRKFQHAIPTYMEQLAEMFHGIVVDGSSSCIPGDVHRVYEEQEEDGDGEDLLNSSTLVAEERGALPAQHVVHLKKAKVLW